MPSAAATCEFTGDGVFSGLGGNNSYWYKTREGITGSDVVEFNNPRSGRGHTKVKCPLWSFWQDDVPLSVTLYREEGFWFAEVESLNVIGEGDTREEALVLLKERINYFVDFYKKSRDEELTNYALRLKNNYLLLSTS